MSESFGEAIQRLQTEAGCAPEHLREVSQGILEMATGDCSTKEVSPGIWEHTFTPKQPGELHWIDESASFTDSDFDRFLFHIRQSINEIYRVTPDMLFVSPETMRQVRHAHRIGQLYCAHPVPHRKIRKCHMRKLQARWRKGREYIQRVELAERAREKDATR